MHKFSAGGIRNEYKIWIYKDESEGICEFAWDSEGKRSWDRSRDDAREGKRNA